MNRTLLVLGAVAVLLLAPHLVGSVYYTNLISQIMIAAIMALSLNLLVGYGGLVSLGHAAYPGVAAYIVAWLVTQTDMGHLAAVLLAVSFSTTMAAFFGLLALRAKGLSFLMITLAFGQILWGVAYRWVSVTGGDNGISGVSRPVLLGISLQDPFLFFYFTALVFIIALTAMALFVHSPFGASLQGTRDQERRMSALGYNVWMIRWLTFVIAGFWGAIAGLLYIYYHQFISPHALILATSAELLLMVIAGGAGTLSGPVVGAALVLILKNVASAYIARWMMLLGAVFVIIVMFVPEGLVPGSARLRARTWSWMLRRLGLGRRSTEDTKLEKGEESA